MSTRVDVIDWNRVDRAAQPIWTRAPPETGRRREAKANRDVYAPVGPYVTPFSYAGQVTDVVINGHRVED